MSEADVEPSTLPQLLEQGELGATRMALAAGMARPAAAKLVMMRISAVVAARNGICFESSGRVIECGLVQQRLYDT